MRKALKSFAHIQLLCLLWTPLQAAGAFLKEGASVAHSRTPVRPAAKTDSIVVPDFQSDSALKHFPAVSRTHIAFVYANDIWYAPRETGVAAALTNSPGMKYAPRFSPDGRTIAFAANLEGNQEIYTIPLGGGSPTRVTHLPQGKALCQWTPDGRLLFYTNSLSFNPYAMQLFTVMPTGGLPAKLAVAYGADGAISSDGQWLAYTQNWSNVLMNTWKRYRGGMAQDIWLFNLRTHISKRVTDWEGTDNKPMWQGETLYYVSDAGPEHRHNIWAYDMKSERRRQITHFAEYDVKNPSIGPGEQGQGEIIFQYASDLYLLDLGTGKSRRVEVVIPEQHRRPNPVTVDAGKFLTDLSAAPMGNQIAVEARGDIWILPSPRNLTHTSGVFEREPAWSPDGKWIAYFSDSTGEYELYVTRPDGSGEAMQLTNGGPGFRYRPTWSPDSKRVAFIDNSNTIYVHTIGSGETKRVDADVWGERPQLSWSQDSLWLAYAKTEDNSLSSIWLYSFKSGTAHQITTGMYDDSYPAFDNDGDYLFFVSTRNFSSPGLNPLNNNFVYQNQDTVIAVPLRKGVTPPGRGEARAKVLAQNAPDEKPLVMDLEGIEKRAIRLPIQAWNIRNLSVVHDGKLIYVRIEPNGNRSINAFHPAEQKENVLLDGVTGFSVSTGGKTLAARKGTELVLVDATTGQHMPIPTSGMTVEIDPRAEWRQIFNDAWRLYRDFFYDPNMHKVDWPAMRERYGKLLDSCATRDDVNYVIGEMVGELNVGHAYMTNPGDIEQPPSAVSVGMLGADFELNNGAYRIARIYEGAGWDTNSRGPLSQPGLKVKPGDYLLAVNGKPLDVRKDPWAAFQGLANRDTTLTIGNKPVIDDSAWQITLKPLAEENSLRNLAWVEASRAYVEHQTRGKVGYLHLPDFSINGLNALVRQLYGQIDKDGLIIDIRWSAGGFLGDVFVRLLDRSVFNYLGGRYSKDRPVPWRAHHGPKCLLVSGMTVSAGENFAYYFRKSRLGKVIGTRTWGGLIGLNGNPSLIDGGYFNIPNAPFFEDDGTWMIEGHGLEPDIQIIGDPAMIKGTDPQMDAAIEEMLKEIKRNPYVKARRPAYPDRSGMSIKDPDK